MRAIHLLFLVALITVCMGTTCRDRKARTAVRNVTANSQALEEESKALTTGALDALQLAPTNPPVDLARKFLVRDQAIEGLPLKRYDVGAILTGIQSAIDGLSARFASVDQLLADRIDLARKLDSANAKLLEMGRLYEAEKNKSFWQRFRHWGVGTFGTLGFIAFLVFCPGIAIPILTRVVGAIVNVIPKLAGWFGVVTTKMVDGIVKGVEHAKVEMRKKGEGTAAETLKNELAVATDKPHKDIIVARKEVLERKGELLELNV